METAVMAWELMFSIGSNVILDNVSIEIAKGSFFALFGADDAGKTTLLHLLCGFARPDEGTVEMCGQNPYPGILSGKGVRFVPDDIIWEEKLTGRTYLDLCRDSSLYYKEEIEQELCDVFHLPLDKCLMDLTYGENKMIQIVGAISAMPDVLILDEPGNFLSKEVYRQLLDCLEVLCRQEMTVLLAAESYEDVRSYCTHYAYLKEGRIVASAEIPVPDYRKKMVIVSRKNQEGVSKMDVVPTDIGQKIAHRRGREYYLFSGNAEALCQTLAQSGFADVVVEELTLEEELDCNYERWL